MKNAPYQRIGTILATMIGNRMSNEPFDSSVKRSTQSACFMDASTQRALNSPSFVGSLPNFVKSYNKKHALEWRIPTKAEVVLRPGLSEPWPHSLSLTFSSDEAAREKNRQARHKAQISSANYFKKNHKSQNRYLSATSFRDANLLSLGHQALFSHLSRQSNFSGIPLQPHILVTDPTLPVL